MAIKINFDSTHNIQSPTYILATKNGRKLGKLPAYNITFKDALNSYSEIFFRVNKSDCDSNRIQNSTVRLHPINFQYNISSYNGFVKIGDISMDKYNELVYYLTDSDYRERITEVFMQFKGNNNIYKYVDLNISYYESSGDIYISDSTQEYLIIHSDGEVYINNDIDLDLTDGTVCNLDVYCEIPVTTQKINLWEQLKDFKLMYCKEYKMWFELYVEIDESNHMVKNVSAKSLGEAELSQINLYEIEINTETDISREDYKPTVLFDEENSNASLLNRITEKIPHYTIAHVDSSIAKIQRTYTFNDISIYDAFQEIAQEINCIFVIRPSMSEDGKIQRTISVYDLESYCLECGHRDDFTEKCPKCASKNILTGYGEDTTIFVSTDNLADDIQYSANVDSVKNCFKLEAGDDLMTATIVNCNPNGSSYIWYISDELKSDMSDDLVQKLSDYDEIYNYYINNHTVSFTGSSNTVTLSENVEQTFIVGKDVQVGDTLILKCLISEAYVSYTTKNGFGSLSFSAVVGEEYKTEYFEVTDNMIDISVNEYVSVYLTVNDIFSEYNGVVEKYKAYDSNLSTLPESIVGYANLMNEYYNTIDLYLLLNNKLMPSPELSDTTAAIQASKLTSANLSPVSVQDIEKCSTSTVSSAVLSMAKVIVDSRYQVKINNGLYDGTTWTGNFIVTNYSDEEDSAISSEIQIAINDNMEDFVKQKIDKALSNSKDDVNEIVSLFKLELANFTSEIKKYCLTSLNVFYDSCQACLNILIEQGIANKDTWENQSPNLYETLYLPYYNKLSALQDEIRVREKEIAFVIGLYDKSGELIQKGVQNYIEEEQNKIQDTLNFEKYLGRDLWLEFVAYRREDTYKNENYISDGLDNAELFDTALKFIEVAKKDIFKSATLQHTITATLKNLLVMKEFSAIINYFAVGNWIRIRIDNNIYKLRIVEFEIDYDNLDNISIVFSDVKNGVNGISDAESILNQAASISTSYGAVYRQAEKSKKTNAQLDGWVTKGLALTKMKIVDSADNQNITWDSHGLLCKEYLPITDTYSDKQLKLINRGLYLTDDNWLTSRAGIGDFTFYNPETGKMEEAYGVIADTLIGNLILSEKVGIYNTSNSITLDKNGIVITTDNTSEGINQMAFTIQKKSIDTDGNERITQTMYIDADGNLVLNGTIRINSTTDTSISTLDDLTDSNRFTSQINEAVHNESQIIYNTIDEKYAAIIEETNAQFESYKADIGQYMQFDDNGLTLGATSSEFKTVIDNRGMYFKQGDNIVSYVNNHQLHIPNAVIENTLILGNFFFSPREDGGVSLTWQNKNDIETEIEEFAIISQPQNQTVSIGETAKFNIVAVGEGLTYQWQYDNGRGWTNSTSTSAKTNTYNITPANVSVNGEEVRCIITDINGDKLISDVAILYISTSTSETEIES